MKTTTKVIFASALMLTAAAPTLSHERARGAGAVTDTAPQDRFPPAVLVGHGSEFAAKMPFTAAASMPAEQTSPLPVGLQR